MPGMTELVKILYAFAHFLRRIKLSYFVFHPRSFLDDICWPFISFLPCIHADPIPS